MGIATETAIHGDKDDEVPGFGQTREDAPPLDDPMAALQASHSYIDDKIAKGAFDCYYQFAAGDQSMCIVNANSAEEMWENLSTLDVACT